MNSLFPLWLVTKCLLLHRIFLHITLSSTFNFARVDNSIVHCRARYKVENSIYTHNSSEPAAFDQIWKELCHIEPMTSKVQPAADYWTVDQENLGTKLCCFCRAEKQRARHFLYKNLRILWINNQAIIEFGCRRIWRILQISEVVIYLGLRPQ